MAQGEQTVEQKQPEQQIQQEQVQTTEPDYRKLYEETQGKVKEYEGKWNEASSQLSNFEEYFNTDKVSAERARLYLQAVKENKNPEDLWKTLDAPKLEAKPKEPQVDVAQIEKQILDRIQPTLQSFSQAQEAQVQQAAEIALERDKAEAFKSEPWLTNELWKEFENRFGKDVQESIAAIMSSKGPLLTQAHRNQAFKEAQNEALMPYAKLSQKQLLQMYMSDHRDKFIAEGRRAAPKMPEGMATDLPTGKAPQLLEQLKRKYKAVEGSPKVKDLIAEYAPQLGLSEEKTYALVANE